MTAATETRRSRQYVRDAIVIGVGVGTYGVTFGVLAVASGASVWQAVALSLLTFTGASQFAVVGVLAAGGSPAAALGSGLVLAARNSAYGLALSRRIGGSLPRRLLAAHLVIDESTAMATSQADPDDAEGAFWATGLAIFALWNLGTLVGALSGQAIGDPARWGLDVAFPAGFLALLAPALRTSGGRRAMVAGAAVALVSLPVAPPGLPVLLAVLGAAAVHLVERRRPS